MSFKAMAWATEQETTKTSSQTLLLVVLANFANENHESYPSVETLSRLARMDKRTVRKGLLELQAMGLIFDTQKRHQKQIVVYQLLVDGGNKNDTPNKNVGGTKLQSRGDNFVSKGGTKLHERGYKNDTQTYYEPINKPINEPVSIDTHEHTHENLENSQITKPNKSPGKSPSAKKPKITFEPPSDLRITDNQFRKCLENGLDVNDQLERFKIWALSKGQGYANWSMAFSNWINRSIEFKARNPQPQTPQTYDQYGNLVGASNAHQPNHQPHPNSTTAYVNRLQQETLELKRELYPERYR